MDGQRQRSGNGRRRRRKARAEQRGNVEPILIAARRPGSPLIAGRDRSAVASAAPSGRRAWGMAAAMTGTDTAKPVEAPPAEAANGSAGNGTLHENGRRERAARIVQIRRDDTDDRERERRRMMDRLMASETRGAITRAANDYAGAGFDFPEEQPVQLQLLEHFDEERARGAIEVLARLIAREAPLKKPILEQRLRRLEEYADEPATRTAAAELRRAIRS